MFTQENLTSPFALGLYLGLIFCFLALWNFLRLKGEMARFRRHLSDKLEIEAETMKKIKTEQEGLRKENESLRVKVNALNELPDRKLTRDLEVYARAEKKMLIQVPGFAPAWETAKSESQAEMIEEESGRSAPRRIFSRLFGGREQPAHAALPGRGEEAQRPGATHADGDHAHAPAPAPMASAAPKNVTLISPEPTAEKV